MGLGLGLGLGSGRALRLREQLERSAQQPTQSRVHRTKETVAAATRVEGKRAPEKAWVIFSEIPLPSLLEM